MAERYGIDNLPTGTELDAQIGIIEIDGQGGIFYNGEDISSDIKDKCEKPDLTIENEETDFIDEIIKILPADTQGVSEGG